MVDEKRRGFLKKLVAGGVLASFPFLAKRDSPDMPLPVLKQELEIDKPSRIRKHKSIYHRAAYEYLIINRGYFYAPLIQTRIEVKEAYQKKYNYKTEDVLDIYLKTINLAKMNPELALRLMRMSEEENINLRLLFSFAISESNFGANNKRSRRGAISPLQVTKKNIVNMELDPKDPNSPYIAAARLIREAGENFKIDVSKNAKFTAEEIVILTACYNAGTYRFKKKPKTVLRYGETRTHIPYVLIAMERFKFLVPSNVVKDKDGLLIVKETTVV